MANTFKTRLSLYYNKSLEVGGYKPHHNSNDIDKSQGLSILSLLNVTAFVSRLFPHNLRMAAILPSICTGMAKCTTSRRKVFFSLVILFKGKKAFTKKLLVARSPQVPLIGIMSDAHTSLQRLLGKQGFNLYSEI